MSLEKIVIFITMGIYLLLMLWVGRRSSQKITDLNEYILAGQGLTWPILTMTFLATVGSTVQLLGQPGFSYENGFALFWWEKATFMSVIVLLTIPLAKRLRYLRVSTIADIALSRFPDSKRVHIILTLVQIIWAVFVAALSVFGGSLLVTAVTGIPLGFSLLVIVGVTLIYTIMGGLSAVAITDAVQWCIIIIGSAMFIPLLYLSVDTFTNFFSEYLGADGLSPTKSATDTGIFPGYTDIYTFPVALITGVGFMLSGSGLAAVDPAYIQRLVAAKNMRHVKISAILFSAMYGLIMTIILNVGNYAGILLPNIGNPDNSLLIMAQKYLPVFGAALFLTAVAAAAMSTISSYLNVAAGMIVKNIIMEFKKDLSDRNQIRWARISTFIVAMLALSFAPIASTGLITLANGLQIGLITSVGPLIFLILFWRKLTEKAAFWGTLISILCTIALEVVVGGPEEAILGTGILGIPVIFWSFIITMLIFISISIMQKNSPSNLSVQFKEMFEDNKAPTLKPTKGSLVGLGCMWIGLFTPKIIIELANINSVFPPLSGSFAWFSNALFLTVTTIIVVLTTYLFIRSMFFLKNPIDKD